MKRVTRLLAAMASLALTAALLTLGAPPAAAAPADRAAAVAPTLDQTAQKVRKDAEKRRAFYESPVSATPGTRSSNGSYTRDMPFDPDMVKGGPWVNDCLSGADATTAKGRVYNRFKWCQEVKFKADFHKNVNGQQVKHATSYLTFQGAGIGHTDKRSTRVYWRVKPGTVKYSWPLQDSLKARRMPLEVGVECDRPLDCVVDKGPARMKWEGWEGFGWTYWDITGHESGAAPLQNPDKVSFNNWNFTLDSNDGTYFADKARTEKIGIRCDSANYFNWRNDRYPFACIYTGALPFLTYNTSDPSHGQVAQHIRDALNTPDSTYPKEDHPKRIPGKWSVNAEPLHRVDRDGQFGRSNESWKKSGCGQNTTAGNPWANYYTPATGLPATTKPEQECDEYPFGSTWEGAADPDHDFSVRWVDKSHNGSAGNRLGEFYVNDRILRYEPNFSGGKPSGPSADPYWVNIN
ncbi:hypothetical protein ACIBF1_18265 [Spirillospora sp. NPDC050679]